MALLVLITLARHLRQWTAIVGLGESRITEHRAIRNRYLAIPGCLVTDARRSGCGCRRAGVEATVPGRVERVRAVPPTP